MNGKGAKTALFFPSLAGFYEWAYEYSYLIIRVTAGAILFVHGSLKFKFGLAAVTAAMAKNGFFPAEAFAAVAMFLETVGAVCIVIGLLTRFFAAAVAIEMFFITFFVSFPHGFGFSAPGGGYEFPLMWGLIMFAIALRGGGPYSADRLIGKEL